MKVDYKEIFKLKVMLVNAEIPYEFLDRSIIDYQEEKMPFPFYHIIVYEPNQENIEEPIRLISVIQGKGTYGEKEDLLEIQGLLTEEESKYDSVCGSLSADEVFKRIQNAYKKER